jgi:hypothetical protein
MGFKVKWIRILLKSIDYGKNFVGWYYCLGLC